MKIPKRLQNPALNVPTYLISSLLAQHPGILGADDRSPHHQRSPWHWLPERGLLPDLFCNANASSTWADPSLAFPVHLYSVSLPLGTLTHAALLSPLPCSLHAAALSWDGIRRRVLGRREGMLKQIILAGWSYGGGLPWAASAHTSCQSHSSPCPPAMHTVFH